jgi:hypothetical protein
MQGPPDTFITDEMRAVVGKPLNPTTSFPIATSDIRKWALAVWYPDLPPPWFWDEEAAAASPYGGIVAPEEFNPFSWMAAEPKGADGVPALEEAAGIDPPSCRAILVASGDVEFSGVRMRPGDVIRSFNRIAEYTEREGRMGLQLYTTWSTELINQRDELIRTERVVFVRYR